MEDIEVEEIKFMYNLCDSPKKLQNAPYSSKMLQNGEILAPKCSKMLHFKTEKTCEFCEKTFFKRSNVNKHYMICKEKKKYDENNKTHNIQIEELTDKVEDLLVKLSEQNNNKILNTTNNNTNNDTTNNKILNTTNNKILNTTNNKTLNTTNNKNSNNNNNNIIQNISINNYGEENLKCLTEEYLSKLIKGAFTAIPKLIEKIHFNPEYPENQNIKITNKKEPYIKVRKNNKWELQDKKETLDTIVDDKYDILDDHIDSKEENLTEFEKDIMEKFKERVNNEEDLLKEIKKKTELIILNRSNDIKNE
jgi:hypothetical protein